MEKEETKEIRNASIGEHVGTCECGGAIILQQAPCPDGLFGCLVMHYQDKCQKCGLIAN